MSFILLFLFYSCSESGSSVLSESKTYENIKVANTQNDFSERVIVDSTNSLIEGMFCSLKPLTDSTALIKVKTTNKSRNEIISLSSWIVENKISHSWHNDRAVALGWSAGSGIGLDLIIPFDGYIPIQLYTNILAKNLERDLIVIEGHGDTACVALNFINLLEQPIIVDLPCQSAISNSCISELYLNKDSLKFLWDPNKNGNITKKNVYIKI